MSSIHDQPVNVKGDFNINLPFFEKKEKKPFPDYDDTTEALIRKIIVIGALTLGVASLTVCLGATIAGLTIAGIGIVGLGLGLSMCSGSFSLPFLTLGGIALKITAVGLATLLLQRTFLATGVGSLLFARFINSNHFFN